MKKLRNLIATLAAFTFIVSGAYAFVGLTSGETASAQTCERHVYYDEKIIYYFTDSEPSFIDRLKINYEDYQIVYDIQPFLYEQELAYMLYTGYFWGFNQENNNIVVLEFKGVQIDPTLLQNIIECLTLQGCKVIYVNNSVDEPVSTDYGGDVPCVSDLYSIFYLLSLHHTREQYNAFPDGTTLFLDGRLFGFASFTENFEFIELCASAPELRYIIYNMYYGYDNTVYGKELFKALWDDYASEVSTGLDYFNQTYPSVHDYIEVWEWVSEAKYFDVNEYWNFKSETFYPYLEEYFRNILDNLYYRHVTILLFNENGYYYDLFNLRFKPSNSIDIFGFVHTTVKHAFAIGQWELVPTFKNDLLYIQQNLDEINSNYDKVELTNFLIYIWDPQNQYDYYNQLEAIPAEWLAYYYIPESKYNNDELWEMFKDTLDRIIWEFPKVI